MTDRRNSAIPAVVFRHGRGWVRLCVVFLMTILACAGVLAQQAPGNGEDADKQAEDTSKQVDESEENYRTRMELRDQRYREQPRADMIYSSQAGTEKIDQLPEASREHIKEQLRDMIIASRQWKPGEDVSDYPYEPSAAAQTDAKLRSQEREAWAEQLQKYQQREAAAYADAEGKPNAQAGGQQSGSEGAAGSRQGKNGSAGKSSAAGQSQADAARNSESYEAQHRETEAVSTAGVSENALSFLQGKAGQPGAATPQTKAIEAGESDESAANDDGTAGASAAAEAKAEAEAPPGSLALSELALLQGMNPAPGEASDQPSAEQASGSPSTSEAQQSPAEQRPDESARPGDASGDVGRHAGHR